LGSIDIGRASGNELPTLDDVAIAGTATKLDDAPLELDEQA